jgi:hypothetical protein
MKILTTDFLIFFSVICVIGLVVLLLTSNPIGRKAKTDSSAYFRIVKIEGREYILSHKPLTPLHSCSCKCDSVK